MSVIGKHYYRTAYLTSEEWKTIRIAALARDDAVCVICYEKNTSNDAHHIFYPKSVWKTELQHLVTLCRSCHDLVHLILPKSPETFSEGLAAFNLLKEALQKWSGKLTKSLIVQAKDDGRCWFCRKKDSPYRDLPLMNTVGLPETAAHQALCDECYGDLIKSEYVLAGKPWIYIRKKLQRKKVLTKINNGDLVIANGTGTQSSDLAA